jgi:hypothetical protein
MSWIHTTRCVGLRVMVVGVLVASPLIGLAQQSRPPLSQETSALQVLSPKDGERVPRQGEDPPCPEQGPCTKLHVEGRVVPDAWPFLAVAPVLAAPKIWVQPPIVAVKRDGTFSGMVYLGTEKVGAGEKYNLLVFACQNQQRFKEGEVLTRVPDDCASSDPVTVLRTK